jgi:hypothetical protein
MSKTLSKKRAKPQKGLEHAAPAIPTLESEGLAPVPSPMSIAESRTDSLTGFSPTADLPAGKTSGKDEPPNSSLSAGVSQSGDVDSPPLPKQGIDVESSFSSPTTDVCSVRTKGHPSLNLLAKDEVKDVLTPAIEERLQSLLDARLHGLESRLTTSLDNTLHEFRSLLLKTLSTANIAITEPVPAKTDTVTTPTNKKVADYIKSEELWQKHCKASRSSRASIAPTSQYGTLLSPDFSSALGVMLKPILRSHLGVTYETKCPLFPEFIEEVDLTIDLMKEGVSKKLLDLKLGENLGSSHTAGVRKFLLVYFENTRALLNNYPLSKHATIASRLCDIRTKMSPMLYEAYAETACSHYNVVKCDDISHSRQLVIDYLHYLAFDIEEVTTERLAKAVESAVLRVEKGQEKLGFNFFGKQLLSELNVLNLTDVYYTRDPLAPYQGRKKRVEFIAMLMKRINPLIVDIYKRRTVRQTEPADDVDEWLSYMCVLHQEYYLTNPSTSLYPGKASNEPKQSSHEKPPTSTPPKTKKGKKGTSSASSKTNGSAATPSTDSTEEEQKEMKSIKWVKSLSAKERATMSAAEVKAHDDKRVAENNRLFEGTLKAKRLAAEEKATATGTGTLSFINETLTCSNNNNLNVILQDLDNPPAGTTVDTKNKKTLKKHTQSTVAFIISNKWHSFIIPTIFDTECKPYNIITTTCLARLVGISVSYLKTPIILTPFGPPLTLTRLIKIRVSLSGAANKVLSFNTQALVLEDDKRDFLVLGGKLLDDLKLVDIAAALNQKLANASDNSDMFVETSAEVLESYTPPDVNAEILNFDEDDLPIDDGTAYYLADADVVSHASYESNYRSIISRVDALPALKGTDPETTRSNVKDMLFRCLTAHIQIQFPVDFTVFIDMVIDHHEIFRSGLDASPPTTLPPMKLSLKDPKQSPIRAKPRSLPFAKAQYINKFITQLINFDLVYIDHNATWASPAMAVPKGDSYRMVLDYVKVNDVLEPTSWPMPRVAETLEYLKHSKYFGKFDLDNCYWQFALSPESQKYLSIITPEVVVTPKRMPMGVHNAVSHLQGHLTVLFNDSKDEVKIWLDDVLQHNSTPQSYIDGLRNTLSLFHSVSLLVSPTKVSLLSIATEWLGRIVSEHGVKFHPRQLQPLLAMEAPTTAADLQQFICAAQWFKSAVPAFAQIIQPLQDLLLTNTRACGSSKKDRLKKLCVTDSWVATHQLSFNAIKDCLQNTLTMSYLLPGGTVCVFTDASSTHWGVIVTQVDKWDNNLTVHDQHHKPLAMLSGAFTGPELLAHISEKECYAINEAVVKLSYILARPEGFTLFTDHRNLVFMVDPRSVTNVIKQNSVDKIARWAARLFSLTFSIEHIAGDDNVWADLLTRWGCGNKISATDDTNLSGLYPSGRLFLMHETSDAYNTFHNINYSTMDEEYEFPSLPEIQELQMLCPAKPTGVVYDDSRKLFMFQGKIWIPFECKQMRVRLCIVAHCSGAGHPRFELTLKALTDVYYWENIEEDVKTFCSSCLQCQLFNANKTVLRPWGETLVAHKPNTILEYDYLYIQESVTAEKYLLVVKDKFSGFTILTPCGEADSETAVRSLLQWDYLFGTADTWVSDRGTHFKNKVMSRLADALGLSEHHFTTAYCPWSNGSVERLNRSVLAIIRKLMSENNIPDKEWPLVIHLINKIINETPSTSRGGFSPRQIFTGMTPKTPLNQTYFDLNSSGVPVDITQPVDMNNYVNTLLHDLDALHDNIFLRAKNNVELRRGKRLKNKAVHITNFQIGDFVLNARVENHFAKKLVGSWSGPYVIVDTVNDYVFKIRDLLYPEKIFEAHVMRLRLYKGQPILTNQLLDQIKYDRKQITYDKFLNVYLKQGKILITVKWLGFADEENTEETLESCYEHNPEMVLKYLSSLTSSQTKHVVSRALAFCRALDERQ